MVLSDRAGLFNRLSFKIVYGRVYSMNRKNALILLYPNELLHFPTETQIPKGYYTRGFKDSDTSNYLKLLEIEGWKLNKEMFDDFFHSILPDGLYLVIEEESEEIVATAVALHNPKSSYYTFPFGGDIGYVITHPNHRKKGLGLYVTALATNRLITAGYKSIRIVTNDHRLPALKTYLKLGFVPFLYASDMKNRWKEVYKKLEIEFSIQDCVTV